jgi:Pyridoxamine 5'-phosphate oxidase
MSVTVGLEELHDRIEASGPRAFLVTVSEDGRPHVVSVVVSQQGDGVAFGAGRTSRANLQARPTATLLWPPGPADGGEYSLIVDGHGDAAGDDTVTLHATAAVPHRIAGSIGDGPSCIPVLPRD